VAIEGVFKNVGVPSAAKVKALTCEPAVAPVLIVRVPSSPLLIPVGPVLEAAFNVVVVIY
jgi:hypothetical protein